MAKRTGQLIGFDGRVYEIEIAFVRFLGGWVIWIDDDPMNEGEPEPTLRTAWRSARRAIS